MDVWSTYQSRIAAHGGSKRNASLIRETRMLRDKLPDSLSYQSVVIYPQEYGYNITEPENANHKIKQNVAIINSDNLDEKTIMSLPGEDVELGSLIYWMDSYWLVTERDFNTTVYAKGKLIQCNHLLKWVTKDGKIIEQWVVFEDGTKYLAGYAEDNQFIISRADARSSIQLARNQYTVVLDRTYRFLLDDEDTPHKMAYQLTKPLKGNLTYGGKGIYSFVLQEVPATKYDNHELGIADYYKYFDGMPEEDSEEYYDEIAGDVEKKEEPLVPAGKKVWL